MPKSVLEMIEQFGGEVEEALGTQSQQKIMSGASALNPKTPPATIALWMRDAVARLDTAAPQEICYQVMGKCGYNCSRLNYTAIKRGLAHRAKFTDEEAFLDAEIRKPQAGTRLEREGGILYQIYTPRAYAHPMRCFCGLMRNLPDGQEASATYCQCSKAFARAYWSEVLGRPVAVELLESALTGALECRFKITL